MVKVRKCIKYDDIITVECHYSVMHNKSVYKVEYSYGTTEQLSASIIAENMLSQVDSECRHYQVLTEFSDHKRN